MGVLLNFPRKELGPDFFFHLSEFGPASDEIGAILVVPWGVNDKAQFIIFYYPLSIKEANWEDEIELEWQIQIKKTVDNALFPDTKRLRKFQVENPGVSTCETILLIWNPVIEDGNLKGGKGFEIIWRGVLAEKLIQNIKMDLSYYLSLKYPKGGESTPILSGGESG